MSEESKLNQAKHYLKQLGIPDLGPVQWVRLSYKDPDKINIERSDEFKKWLAETEKKLNEHLQNEFTKAMLYGTFPTTFTEMISKEKFGKD